MPSGHMDDIELKDIDLHIPTVRSLSKSASIESQQVSLAFTFSHLLTVIF